MGFGTLFKWEGQIAEIAGNKIKLVGENDTLYILELNSQAVHELVTHPVVLKGFNETTFKGDFHPTADDMAKLRQIIERRLIKKVVSIEIKK